MRDSTTILRSIVCATLLVAVVLLVFAQTVPHPFSAWDDDFNIPGNKNLHPVSWQGVINHWREPYGALYVPVTYTFWAAESWLAAGTNDASTTAELQPWVFHAGNVLLHAINVLLVWHVLRLVVRSDGPALCGALLYALHPLQVESVAWITETKGLLSAAFAWLALWQHLVALSLENTSRRTRWLHHTVAALAFALAILAKPSVVVLPVMALLLDVIFFERRWQRSFAALAPWFALAMVGLAITAWQQSGDGLPFEPPPIWQRPFVAGDAVAFYLRKLLVPAHLAIDYSRRPATIFESFFAYVTWLVPIGLILLLAMPPQRRAYLVAFALFVVGLLPVLGLVPFAYQVNSTVADRYVYLAMLGPALAVAWFLSQHSTAFWYAAFAAIAVVLGATSAWQTSYWRDDRTLFQHTLDVNPRSYLVRGMLANELLLAQPPETTAAIEQFRASIPYSHEPAKPHTALGMIFYTQGNLQAALVEFERAIELDDQLVEAHNGRGATLVALGRGGEAIAEFRRTIEVDPSFGVGWFNLARVLRQAGQKDRAIEAMRRGLATIDDPHAPEHRELQAWLAE